MNFKPNLIPNNPKDGSFDKNQAIEKNGGPQRYFGVFKKDGCRLQLGLGKDILTRSLKAPKSSLVNERFKALNQLCLDLKISLDGEFYMHGLKFNEIFRFFSNEDVTRNDYKEKLEKELKKDPKKFDNEYGGRGIEFLTTFHEDLKFWFFDGIVLDRPDIIRFEDRMNEIGNRLKRSNLDALKQLIWPVLEQFKSVEEIDNLYESALELGFEGLVLTHKDHQYKMGRNSLNEGTLLKMKDDAIEYDGIVIDIQEATKIKEGLERTTNELGRSVTSKKKDDREQSGMAKSFTIEFEGLGTFDVGLKGFDNEAKVELLKNKDNYIGRHFKYKAMAPVKDFPRHAYFDCWRDEK